MTTLEDSVKQRIEATVPQLVGAIDEAADLAALISANALPQREVFAFVLPLGFRRCRRRIVRGRRSHAKCSRMRSAWCWA